MGITVLSSVSANVAPAALVPGLTSDTPNTTQDFALLLVDQLSASLAGITPAPDDTANVEPTQGLIIDSTSQISIDPALIGINTTFTNLVITSFKQVEIPESENTFTVSDMLHPETLKNAPQHDQLLLEQSASKTSFLSSSESIPDAPAVPKSVSDKPQNFSDLLSKTQTPNLIATPSQEPKFINLVETVNLTADKTLGEPSAPSTPLAMSTGHAQAPLSAQKAMTESTIPTPINQAQWANHLGEKVVWLARNEQQIAQININPPQLGPMQISLSMSGDQATAMFASPHAEVRQVIEDAMPRLREMLSSAGVSLGEANVGAQLPQQNRENSPQFANTPSNGGRIADENDILGRETTSETLPILRGRGLVDLFA